ncbi:hypothetical protein HELRODRAFT_192780 [Helobdella robusta]|uniref:FYVE-type domain-containing protein n=1 Tax=Helobdella robusta TaxID=6412 RepID=T1FUA0_HELRO|nr:hypothetical protein HELRODRAFT_192780 [Helobdella robusta]ESN99764.1 hypothetical protein HELRODRAFT_192780 [Helobdella robusta]
MPSAYRNSFTTEDVENFGSRPSLKLSLHNLQSKPIIKAKPKYRNAAILLNNNNNNNNNNCNNNNNNNNNNKNGISYNNSVKSIGNKIPGNNYINPSNHKKNNDNNNNNNKTVDDGNSDDGDVSSGGESSLNAAAKTSSAAATSSPSSFLQSRQIREKLFSRGDDEFDKKGGEVTAATSTTTAVAENGITARDGDNDDDAENNNNNFCNNNNNSNNNNYNNDNDDDSFSDFDDVSDFDEYDDDEQTGPSPSSPLDSNHHPLIADEYKKSFNVARELVQTEVFYVQKLHLIDQMEIIKSNRQHRFMPAELIPHIFSNVKSIYEFHNDCLLPELTKSLDLWKSGVLVFQFFTFWIFSTLEPTMGAKIRKVAPYLKMYTVYVTNFTNATNLITALCAKSEKFNSVLQSLSDKFKKILDVCESIVGGNHENLVTTTREFVKEGRITKLSARDGSMLDRYIFLAIHGAINQLIRKERTRDELFIEKTYSTSEELGKRAPKWVKDQDTSMCMICCVKFHTFRRRHHCRACGKVVCSVCSAYKLRIDYDKNHYNRVCYICYQALLNNSNGDGVSGSSSVHFSSGTIRLPHRHKGPSALELKTSEGQPRLSGPVYFSWDRKGWSKRWATLHYNCALYVYKAKKDNQAEFSLPLPGYTIEPLTSDDLLRSNCFRVFHGQLPKVYFFSIDDKTVFDKWVSDLDLATKVQLPPPPPLPQQQQTSITTSSSSPTVLEQPLSSSSSTLSLSLSSSPYVLPSSSSPSCHSPSNNNLTDKLYDIPEQE